MRLLTTFMFTVVFTLISNGVMANGMDAFKAENYDRAFRLWFMTLSEDPLNSEANFGLGRIVLEGLGTTIANQKEGLSYLNASIDAGSREAAVYLANAYRDGEFVDENISKEIEYLAKAEKNGAKGLTGRLGSLYKKRDGALSAQGCKTYNKNRNSDAYSVAQCIERGFLTGRAADFYKVAFREGENGAYLRAGKYLLDPVSADVDYDFMAQYMLAFLRKANNKEVNQFRELINKNGITADSCGIQADQSSSASRSRDNNDRNSDSRRANNREDRSTERDRRSRDSRDRDSRSRDRDSRSSTRDRSDENNRSSSRSSAVGELNPSMCILAAEGGDPIAQVEVAKWFSTGDKGLALDQEYADQLLERGAGSGSTRAIELQLTNLWADGAYEKRLAQLNELIIDSKTEQLARDALVNEAEYLLEMLKEGEGKWQPPAELKEQAGFIFGAVSVQLIRPDLRLVLYREEYKESFGSAPEANVERIDLGSDDLFDSYRDFFTDRYDYLPEIAQFTMEEALKKGNACKLLAYINDNKRDFGEFGEDLVKDFGKDCSVKSPGEYIQIAEDYFKDKEYRRGIDILDPLVAEENCNAIALAVRFEKESGELRDFVSSNKRLITACNDKGDSSINLAENRLEAAKLFLEDEAYAKASDVLALLIKDSNCKGFELAVANRSNSRQLKELAFDNTNLFEKCASQSDIVAVGYLETLLNNRDRQMVFDIAANYCTDLNILGACPVATELLMDRDNELKEQEGKSQWSKPKAEDLRKKAIEDFLLVAVEKNDVPSALMLIELVMFEKLSGTSLFKKDAERAIDRLVASRNINGQALALANQLNVTNPVDLLNNLGSALTGNTKRRCTELKSYDGDAGLEPFVQEFVTQILAGQLCGIYN